MYSKKRNVTYIDQLPDLEDLERNTNIPTGKNNNEVQPGGVPEKFRKFIRTPMKQSHPESGMTPSNYPQHQEFYNTQHQEFYNTQPQEFYNTQPQKPFRQTTSSPTCLDVESHVSNCPICSKFYKNENAIYIIAIVVLSIICILLLKRVLNV